MDCSIDGYKARFMVKGHTQQEGIYYEETFLSIFRFTFIHFILAIMAHIDLEFHQMDVKMIFSLKN